MRQGKALGQPWGVRAQRTQLPDTHQPRTVVTWEVLVADLYQAPEGLLRRARTRRQGWGQRSGEEAALPSHPRPPGPHADLSRHVHEQDCGHGGLGLAVTLIRPVDGVGLQDAVQVLLPK